MSTPARGYTWPAFSSGNTAALRHGADSPRVWRPLAEAIAAELVDVAPWTARPAFAAAVAAWSRVEAQCQLVTTWLDEHGVLDADGEPRSAANYLLRLEAQAASLRARLGLDPTAMVRLLSAVAAAPETAADGLEALRSEGRRLLEAKGIEQ